MTTPTTVQVQIQLRADTAANWASENPTLLANEVGLENDTKKLKVGNGSTAWNSLAYFPSIVTGGTVLGNLEIGTTGTLTFEGSTANGFETTLAVTDPTADRTITLPDQSGTVVVTGNASIVNADIAANAEIAVSKLADGAARQLLQTDAAGTGVEWTSNVDVPGTLDVTGAATFDDDVTIEGDLTVNGTTTTIDTETLLVKDKNIELAVVDTPTDLTADGGGITLKGATDKTLTWSDTTDAWTSNQVVDLPAGSAATPSLIFGADVNSGIYSPGADQVAISSNAVQRVNFGTGEVVFNDGGEDYDFRIEGDTEPNLVFIDASTNRVGLGTSSPATDLHLSKTTGPVFRIGASAGVGDDASTGRIEFYGGATAGNGPGIKAAIDTESTSGTARDFDLLFKTSTNVGSGEPLERLRITADGSVGIGTINPEKTLHIYSSLTAVVRAESTTANSRLELKNSGGTPYIGGNNNDLNFFPGGAAGEAARIDSAGRLLVGTISDITSNTNYVIQSVAAGGGSIALARNDGTVGADESMGRITFYGNDGGSYEPVAQIECQADDPHSSGDKPGRLVFSTTADGAPSPTEAMRIRNDGQVLIGATANSKSGRLEVTGRLAVLNGRESIQTGSTTYTASTTATEIIQFDSGAGAFFGAELFVTLLDSGSPAGTIVQKVYVAARGSGANVTAVSVSQSDILRETSASGTFTGYLTWTAAVVSNRARLSVTATQASGAATLAVHCNGAPFSFLI